MAAPPSKSRAAHKTAKPTLSACEVRFAAAYADHGNATKAYRDAGFATAGLTETAVWQAASRLVRNRQVRLYIRRIQQAATDEAGVTTAYLVQGFKRTCDADPLDLYDADGHMLPPHLWPERIRLCVKKIKPRLFLEDRPDPADATKLVKVAVVRYEVEFESRHEARKVLAQWKRLIGQDAEAQTAGRASADQMVIRGEADPESLK